MVQFYLKICLLKFLMKWLLARKAKNLVKKMINNSNRLLVAPKNGEKNSQQPKRYQMDRFQNNMILEILMVMTLLDQFVIKASVVHAIPSPSQGLLKPDLSSNTERKSQAFHHNR